MRHERGDEMLETAPGIVHEVIVVIMVLFGVGVGLTILGIDV